MSSWPPVQTPDDAHKIVRFRDWVSCILTVLVKGPLILGLVVLLTPLELGFPPEMTEYSMRALFSLLALVLIAAASIPPLIFGSILFYLALRHRRAGWAIALLSGAVIALIYFRIVYGHLPMRILSFAQVLSIGSFFAGALWLTMRKKVPRAFTRFHELRE